MADHTTRILSTLRDDVRFAVRHVTRRPLFSATVIGTLALAMAAATTTFGLATAVLSRPCPSTTPPGSCSCGKTVLNSRAAGRHTSVLCLQLRSWGARPAIGSN